MAELQTGSLRYVLSAGDWFEVDKTFADATAAAVNGLATSAIAFPSSPKGEPGADYLARAAPLLTASEGMPSRCSIRSWSRAPARPRESRSATSSASSANSSM